MVSNLQDDRRTMSMASRPKVLAAMTIWDRVYSNSSLDDDLNIEVSAQSSVRISTQIDEGQMGIFTVFSGKLSDGLFVS